jgi:hypothetical protein
MNDELYKCVRTGNLEKLKSIYEENEENNVNMDEHNDNVFIISCWTGKEDIAQWILYNYDVNIHAEDEGAFRLTCWWGFFDIAQWIWDESIKRNSPINIHANKEDAFNKACKYGHLEMTKWLWKLSQEIKSPIDLHADNDYAIIESYKRKKMDVVEWLCSICEDFKMENLENMNIDIMEKIKTNANDIVTLEKYVKNICQIERNNKDLVCGICRNTNEILLNLKCQKRHDHCYCVECFCAWYKTNEKKCVYCFTQFGSSYTFRPRRRDREIY